jgi:plasmid stabilization system protein ParE
MKLRLMPRAQHDLREYSYYIAASNPEAAERESDRILDALEHFVSLPAEGVLVHIRDCPRPVHRGWLPPFRVYYERMPMADVLVIHRLYHHARRPIEHAPKRR